MNKASIMNPFSFKQTEGANLQALTNSISLLGILTYLFKGNFLWMFPIQLKTTRTASGTSDLLLSLHTKGKSMHLYTIIYLQPA